MTIYLICLFQGFKIFCQIISTNKYLKYLNKYQYFAFISDYM